MRQLEHICDYLWDMAMKEDNDESWYCDAYYFLEEHFRKVRREAEAE
jgi:hypothetical protein